VEKEKEKRKGKVEGEDAELARINSSALAFCCPEGAVFG
jgi:hypothetical protein